MATTNTPLTFSDLRAVNLARCEEAFHHPLKSWSTLKWLVAVGGEVGEALNIVKKLNRVEDGLGTFLNGTTANLRKDLASELADVVIYLDLLLAHFGLDIDKSFIYGQEDAPAPDFNCLRQLIWKRMGYVALPTDAAADVMSSAGSLAHEVICDTVDREDDDEPLFDEGVSIYEAAARLLTDVDILALAAGIDLGAAVISTFNAKSIELGAPHRLEVA